jgi:hypothetical protein
MSKFSSISSRVCVFFSAMLLIAFAFVVVGSTSWAEEVVKFNEKGELMQPKNFEWRTWIYVGTPVTPNSLNPPEAAFPEFHNVYIDPESFKHYSKTGKFRDGTVLIKELVSVGATEASSGKGYFEGFFIGLEASIKDSKRFKDEPGFWAYFTFSHKAPPYPETAVINPAASCNTACHQGKAADDWVFTQFYPVLRAAKPKN